MCYIRGLIHGIGRGVPNVITYEQKASIPLIAMMYILHRQLNGEFLPLADF